NDYLAFLNTVKEYGCKLNKDLMYKITYNRTRIKEMKLRLYYVSPMYQIKQKRQYLMETEQKLLQRMSLNLKEKRHRLELYITKLEALSPLSKLSQGYALVVGEDNQPVQSVKKVKENEIVTISLLDGDIKARVEERQEIARGK
ncbi:MAG TPA: hypothetical protein DEP17_00815, partial [Lachnospiraceae bacterium]|nr:hypothetical protein [Lachnospiraceae bacterium]